MNERDPIGKRCMSPGEVWLDLPCFLCGAPSVGHEEGWRAPLCQRCGESGRYDDGKPFMFVVDAERRRVG